MIDPAKTIETIQNLAPKTLLALGLATGVILFAPLKFIQAMQLQVIRDKFRFWTGLVCLVCWSLIAMHVLWWLGGLLRARSDSKRRRSVRQGHLDKLTRDEKGFLAPYISDEQTTRHADIGDGVVNGLEARGIVYRSASMFKPDYVPFNIQPWARDYLKENTDLLEGATEYPPERSNRW